DAGHSVHDNVEQLRARLEGVAHQAAADPNSSAGGGRHVARGASSPSAGSRRAMRSNAEPGTGGRRRRPDGVSERVGAAPVNSPAGTHGVAGSSSASGHAGASAHHESTPAPSDQNPERTERPYSRGRGIDRVALARLTQMAWRP